MHGPTRRGLRVHSRRDVPQGRGDNRPKIARLLFSALATLEKNSTRRMTWFGCLTAQVSDEQLLRRNDIAICMSSGSPEVVGKTARVPQPSRLRRLVLWHHPPKATREASYLSFFFRSPGFAKHRDAIARGANIQNLRFSQFEEIEFEIPDRPAADRGAIGAGGPAAPHPPLRPRTHRHLPPRRLPPTLRRHFKANSSRLAIWSKSPAGHTSPRLS